MATQVELLTGLVNVAIPEVYQKGMSYYEVLTAVVNKVNELIKQSNEYFSEDVKTIMTNILIGWKDDGTLDALIADALLDIGDRQYTEQNYVTNSQNVTESLDAIDLALGKITKNEFNILSFGGDPTGIADSTAAFNSIIAIAPEGSIIKFPKGSYKGNFISDKSYTLDFQNSEITPASDSWSVIYFGGLQDLIPRTVTGNPVYGQTTFVVDNITDLAINDTGYLVDDAIRLPDSSPDINRELIKIKSIDVFTKTITVYDMIRSNQNTGVVRFYKITSLKTPKVINVKINIPNTHLQPSVYFRRCENTVAENIEINNYTGHGVRNELCYGFRVENVRVLHPQFVGSGEGYGVTGLYSRRGTIKNIIGQATRHLIDFSACYDCIADNMIENDAKSGVLSLTHNGYGGKITVTNLTATSDFSIIASSSQGIADLSKQSLKDVYINNVNLIVPSLKTDEFMSVINIQYDYENLIIENVKVTYINTSATPTTQSSIIRLSGNIRGLSIIRNLIANDIGALVRLEGRSIANSSYDNLIVENLSVNNCQICAFIRGIYSAKVDNIVIKGNCTSAVTLETYGGVVPYRFDYQNVIIKGTGQYFTAINTPTIGLHGKYPQLTEKSTSGVSVTDGLTITAEQILNASNYLLLVAQIGATNTLNATTPFEAPLWIGQEFKVIINSLGDTTTRGTVTIPAGSLTYADGGAAKVLAKGNVYTLIGYNGKWRVKE